MKITVCIGSSCHLKGSRQIVEQLKSMTAEKNLQDKIDLCGAFCMGYCTKGVCVRIDDELFSLQPEDVRFFFESDVLQRL